MFIENIKYRFVFAIQGGIEYKDILSYYTFDKRIAKFIITLKVEAYIINVTHPRVFWNKYS